MHVALALIVGLGLVTLLGGDALRPIGCLACGDPLVDHLQSLELMPDYCPSCGLRL